MTKKPKPLDPRFVKVVALMRSTQHDGERATALARAEAMARAAGLTLKEALAKTSRPAANPLTNFAEWMEEREPGWTAREHAARLAKIEVW